MIALSLRACVAAVLLAALAAPDASAQQIRPLDERVSTAPGYFVYVLPGERSVQVTVLGTVRAPGFYTVSDGVDLGQVLALAGGPAVTTLSTEVERTVTIRLFRGQAQRDMLYEASLEDFARDASAYPRLVDGDLIEVTTVERRLRTIRDTLTIVGAAASIVVAVTQIIRLFQ
jgi:protein involved in polysaccharide export with SLBB domain